MSIKEDAEGDIDAVHVWRWNLIPVGGEGMALVQVVQTSLLASTLVEISKYKKKVEYPDCPPPKISEKEHLPKLTGEGDT